MPSIARDGVNVLDLSVESDNSENFFVGKTKKARSQRKQLKKSVSKVDSDLEILAELSGDSDGQRFQKSKSNYVEPNVEFDLNLKTTVESSEDDLDSDTDKCRIILIAKKNEKLKG